MEDNRQILVIDDDPGVRETYGEIFAPRGQSRILSQGRNLFGGDDAPAPETGQTYELTLAEDGQMGIDTVSRALEAQAPFSVAFIDMKMPGLNGAETARRIWELDPEIKIVIVTAYSEHRPRDIVRLTGRDDIFYLKKPFTPEEITQFAQALTHTWNLERKREILEGELQRANQQLEAMNQDLKQRVKEQAAMVIQSEKMAAVGILAAGVAHEINNPVAFVTANLDTLKQYGEKLDRFHRGLDGIETQLEKLDHPQAPALVDNLRTLKEEGKTQVIMDDLGDLVTESLDGVRRVETIVKDLKNFSHLDDGQYKKADINEIIQTSLNMVHSQIKYTAQVDTQLEEIPPLPCYPQKLNQVFVNLLINAAQAIEAQGRIHITSRKVSAPELPESTRKILAEQHSPNHPRGVDTPFLEIIVADTGHGIPPEDLPRLFDPFFTTKPVGSGTGLGLSIVYEIIKAHGGHINAANGEDGGACFTLVLPMATEDTP